MLTAGCPAAHPAPSAASRRRRTTDGTKPRRTKSSQLPLERVPTGKGVHHLVYTLSTTVREVSRLADCVNQEKSLLGWGENTADAYGAFANSSTENMQDLSARLHQVLVNRVSDGEMVQDLGVLVQNAFDAYERGAMFVNA